MTTIDDYVTTTVRHLDRSVAELRLPPPAVKDRALAQRTTERLLETLAGLAIGCIVGAAVQGAQRTFGRHVGARIAIAPALPLVSTVWLDDGGVAAPPAELLKLRLRGRIARSGEAARRMLVAVEREIAIEDRPVFARVLGLLAIDELTAERFSRQVWAGWRCAVAVIESRPVPAVEPLWQSWARRIVPPAVAPEAQDVMMRIA